MAVFEFLVGIAIILLVVIVYVKYFRLCSDVSKMKSVVVGKAEEKEEELRKAEMEEELHKAEIDFREKMAEMIKNEDWSSAGKLLTETNAAYQKDFAEYIDWLPSDETEATLEKIYGAHRKADTKEALVFAGLALSVLLFIGFCG